MSPEGGEFLERLFLGVEIPQAARERLQRHLRRVAPHGVPGRAVPPARWHLTLRFLGATDAGRRRSLEAALDVAALGAAFGVELQRLGAFPRPGRASVLWVGVDDPTGALARVAAAAEEAARAAGFGPEEKPFRPHLTLARLQPPVDLAPLVQQSPAAGIALWVPEVVLLRSPTGGGSAPYEAVARWPLAAATPG